MMRVDFFLGCEAIPKAMPFGEVIRELRKMFRDSRKKDRLKSASLPKAIHVNPLVAWAKKNNVSLEGVGKVVPLDPA